MSISIMDEPQVLYLQFSVARETKMLAAVARRQQRVYVKALEAFEVLISKNVEVSLNSLARQMKANETCLRELKSLHPEFLKMVCQYEKSRRSWNIGLKSNGKMVSEHARQRADQFPWENFVQV